MRAAWFLLTLLFLPLFAHQASAMRQCLGIADVVLITDLSNSMDWVMYEDSHPGHNYNDCLPAHLADPDVNRITVARCFDKDLIKAVLADPGTSCSGVNPPAGNKIALVRFNKDATGDSGLSTVVGPLLGIVGNYDTSGDSTGATCIACAINKAYEILRAGSPDPTRNKYIIVMTDGVANIRANIELNGHSKCYELNGLGLACAVGSEGTAAFRSTSVWTAHDIWNTLGNPTFPKLTAIAALGDSLAYAAAQMNGRLYFYKWNGASWSTDGNVLFNSAINGMDVRGPALAFAAGNAADDSPNIYSRESGSWSGVGIPPGTTGHLNGVAFVNDSYAIAVSGTGYIIYWAQPAGFAWKADTQITNTVLAGIDAIDGLAYAVGRDTSGNALIFNWTSSSHSWKLNFSLPPSDGNPEFTDVSVTAPDNVFAAFHNTSGFGVFRWNGANWAYYFLGARGNGLKVHAESTSLAYAMTQGDQGDIFEWDGSSWTGGHAGFKAAGDETDGILCAGDPTGLQSGDCALPVSADFPALNANYSAYRARTLLTNARVSAIGFGPVEQCPLGNQTVIDIAKSGNGSALSALNVGLLHDVYCQIAADAVCIQLPLPTVPASGILYLSCPRLTGSDLTNVTVQCINSTDGKPCQGSGPSFSGDAAFDGPWMVGYGGFIYQVHTALEGQFHMRASVVFDRGPASSDCTITRISRSKSTLPDFNPILLVPLLAVALLFIRHSESKKSGQ